MERNTIVFEFLELRKQLNRGNKTADLATAPSFVIEAVGPSEFRLLFCVAGLFEVQRIEIARCDSSGDWERSGYTSFKNFENYCADFMVAFEFLNSHKKFQIASNSLEFLNIGAKALLVRLNNLLIER
jgi:hypothetical protein